MAVIQFIFLICFYFENGIRKAEVIWYKSS